MTDIDRIREALQFIDASDRETWVEMGMAIHAEFGDTGFDLWDEWSQQAESYKASSARDVWRGFRAGGGKNIGSLIHEAKANGWRDDGGHQKPTPEELAERKRIAAERAAKEEAEIARERADTAKKAAAILKAATEAKADHPYLTRKRVSPAATLREIDAGVAAAILGYAPKSGDKLLTGRLLVVPVKQGDGLSTLELIDGDGRKAALAGRGSKAGGYWATERLPDGDGPEPLQFAEGVATALSGKEANGDMTIATLSAGNMLAVAKAMRERYPTRPFVFLADLVKATGAPDPHAIEAARSVGGKLAIPDFGTDRDPDMTDMNDLFILGGPEAVTSAIANATTPARGVSINPAMMKRQRAILRVTAGLIRTRWRRRSNRNPIRWMPCPTPSGRRWKRSRVSSKRLSRWSHRRHWRRCRWRSKPMPMRSGRKSCMGL